MGKLQAMEMAKLADLETGLTWHFQQNHYPPIPLTMLPTCIKAIELANAEEWGELVELPDGVTYKGETSAPVREIIEQHHLEPWLDSEE